MSNWTWKEWTLLGGAVLLAVSAAAAVEGWSRASEYLARGDSLMERLQEETAAHSRDSAIAVDAIARAREDSARATALRDSLTRARARSVREAEGAVADADTATADLEETLAELERVVLEVHRPLATRAQVQLTRVTESWEEARRGYERALAQADSQISSLERSLQIQREARAKVATAWKSCRAALTTCEEAAKEYRKAARASLWADLFGSPLEAGVKVAGAAAAYLAGTRELIAYLAALLVDAGAGTAF